MPTEEFDVVVVGGGPGGSTLAALVAMRGHQVLVLEKERFPRYQIGESLLPATVHGICRLTGASDALADAGFTQKRGGTFRWGANPDPWTFSFAVSPKVASQTSFAYQVERMKFDQILLENAQRRGAMIREGCAVANVLEDVGRVCGVRYTDANGRSKVVRSRYVVDASGHGSRIYQHVGGTRRYSEFFRSLALFGYFHGGKRLPGPNSGNILSAAFKSGWFWYIPLSPMLTSVGAVVRHEMAAKVQGDPARSLAALIDECDIIRDYLSGAERVTEGTYGRIRVRKDYSYHSTSFWRPGMVLVGDAACFVDPVFSSGVHLASYSALLAARSINSVLARALDEKLAFGEFEARYRREYSLFYQFLMAFYEMHVSEDSYFWAAKKITCSTLPELESFVDLVAGVNSGEVALVNAHTLAKHFESGSSEFASAVSTLTGDREESMLPLFKAAIVRDTMRESAQVQAQGLFGREATEQPLFASNLVPSQDGLLWERRRL
jgi:FAD-dependent halogenase